MDLCLWYQKVSKYSSDENRLKWQLKPDYCFEYTGVVKKIDGKLVCGECLLQDKEVEYTEGDEVGIKLYKGKALRVNNSPFEYDDGENKISVSKYAFANNVIIIRKNY